jgi:capsular polysaccharide biosynthesis protein
MRFDMYIDSMCRSRMRLFCIEDGIPICYNQNETNIETVFSLQDNNTIQQMFTFQTYIHTNDTQFQKEITSAQIGKIIEKGLLFYSFRYQISFAHFMMQTVPLLKDYIEQYSDYSLLIPKHHMNLLCQDILEHCKIPSEKIILLEDRTIYTVNVLAPRKHYHTVPSNYTSDHVWIYSMIRNTLPLTQNRIPTRNVYLRRDGVPNAQFGNSETGAMRRILNEDALIKRLSELGFEIITLGSKRLHEKCSELSNIHTVITPLGANCMNLIFANAPTYCILISNDKPLGQHYYTSLSSELNQSHINTIHIQSQSDPNYTDPLNIWNSAFTVDIDTIIQKVNQIK